MTNPSNEGVFVEFCPNCRGTEIELVSRYVEHVEGNERVSFADGLSRCLNSGEEFYTFDQSTASSKALATALREARGLMSPERIRALRLKLKMSQPQFEQALGLGAKTMAR